MQIQPISWPQARIDSTADFSPLEKIGQMLKQQREEQEASELIAKLYGQQAQPMSSLGSLPAGAGATTGAVPPTTAPTTGPIPLPRPRPPEADPASGPGYFQTNPAGSVNWPGGQPTTAQPMKPWPTAPQPAAPPPVPLSMLGRLHQAIAPGSGNVVAGAVDPLRSNPLYAALMGTTQPDILNKHVPKMYRPDGTVVTPDQLPGATPQNAPQDANAASPVPFTNAPFSSATDLPPPPAQPAPPPVVAPAVPAVADAASFSPAGLDRALQVVRQKESGNNYRNVTNAGNGRKVYGAYGVLDENIPAWTREVLGRSMSPQEFLNNDAAQDAVAKAKFGQYAQKYGLTGAAKAWLAGEGGMNRNVADRFGTTPMSYAADFNRKLGLPPEITSGTSRPGQEPSSQAMAFDQVKSQAVDSLVSPDAQAPAIDRETMAQLYRNPLTRPLAVGLLQKQFDPGTYEFKQVGDNLVRTNSRTGRSEIIMRDVKNDYEVKTVKTDDGGEKLVRVKKQGPEGLIDTGSPDTGESFGKLQPGYRWKDPKDHSKGVDPIPGGSADKIGDEIVARVGLAKSFINTLPDLRERIKRGDVGIENGMNHAQAIANVGTPGETKRMLDAGAEALIRMLTGAGMSQTEANQNAQQYRVTPRDTAFTINSKVNALERHLNAIGSELGRSRGGGNLLASPAVPAAPSTIAPATGYDETKTLNGKTFGRKGKDWYQL